MASPRTLSRLVPLLAASGFALVAACEQHSPTAASVDAVGPARGPAFAYSDSVAAPDTFRGRR